MPKKHFILSRSLLATFVLFGIATPASAIEVLSGGKPPEAAPTATTGTTTAPVPPPPPPPAHPPIPPPEMPPSMQVPPAPDDFPTEPQHMPLPIPSDGQKESVMPSEVRELKREVVLPKGVKESVKSPALEISPGSIKKIFVVVAASNLEQKVILKAIQQLKGEITAKILVVQNKSTAEISNHLTAKGQLSFDSFSEGLRANFPFKPDERMVYLVGGDIVHADGSPLAIYLTNSQQGIGAISMKSLPLNREDSAIQFAKVLKAMSARFYNNNSICGSLAEATTYEALQKLPRDFCPEDKENLKSLKLIP